MASDARETAKQENGSLFVFKSYIEQGKIPTIMALEKGPYPDMPAKWYVAFELQAKALKKYLGNESGYVYSRDRGMMPFLEQIASQEMGVSVKDRWNPMDVVMTKRTHEQEITNKVKSIAKEKLDNEAKLVKLNVYMAQLLEKKILLPISLKEVKKGVTEASIEEANMGSSKSKGTKFKFKQGSLKCPMGMDKNGLLDTGELALDFYADDTEIHVQSRSFRYSIPNTVVQTDLTPKGRQSGAKLGKASTQALDAFLKPLGLERPLSPTAHPMIAVDGNFDEDMLLYWEKVYDKVKKSRISGQTVDLKIKIGNIQSGWHPADLIEKAMRNRKKPNVMGRLTSKLVCLEWLKIYAKISEKRKFEEWLSVLYYGAKKEFSETNGPFFKIY